MHRGGLALITHQWWGPLDGKLHRFEGWYREGSAPCRISPAADCGWAPSDGIVLEMPEGELPPSRICEACREAAELVR